MIEILTLVIEIIKALRILFNDLHVTMIINWVGFCVAAFIIKGFTSRSGDKEISNK